MRAKIDISNTEIRTERLLMRPWVEADLTDLFSYASIPGVGEMAGGHYHKALGDSKKFLDKYIEDKICFALYHLDDQKVIGSLELHGSWAEDDPRFAHLAVTELGTIIAQPYWGQGLGVEVAHAALHYCFDTLGLDAIACCHFVDNHQSRRVIEKCGFSFMQIDTYYSRNMDKEFLERQYIMLKEDFRLLQEHKGQQ